MPEWSKQLIGSWEDENAIYTFLNDRYYLFNRKQKGPVDQGRLDFDPSSRKLYSLNNDGHAILTIQKLDDKNLELKMHGTMNLFANEFEIAISATRLPNIVLPPTPEDIQTAAELGDLDAVSNFLKNGISVNAQNQYGATALHLAAYFCHTDVVKLLLAHKPDLALLTENKKTALVLAIGSNHEKAVELLLDAGASIKTADNGGEESLLEQASFQSDEIIIDLLKYGADLNEKPKFGEPCLDSIIGDVQMDNTYKDRLPVIRYLVEDKKIDVNKYDDFGYTPIFYAVHKGLVKTVKYLVSKGAKTDLKSKDGGTVLDYAQKAIPYRSQPLDPQILELLKKDVSMK